MIALLLSLLLVFSAPPAVTDTSAVAPPAPAADTVPPLAI
jgi:hypothetical protein